MATTHLRSEPVQTVGELPATGQDAPDFTLTGQDLAPVSLADLRGHTVVLNIFPSLDTGVCAASVRTFNAHAADLPETVVLAVSADLPFAAARFCSAEGIQSVVPASVFRSDFGTAYGVQLAEGPMEGLLARAVVVIDPAGVVTHTELVSEITQEPDYEAALDAARG